jgi:hypothetical protein
MSAEGRYLRGDGGRSAGRERRGKVVDCLAANARQGDEDVAGPIRRKSL